MFNLCVGVHSALMIEDHETRARRSLVDCGNKIRHGAIPAAYRDDFTGEDARRKRCSTYSIVGRSVLAMLDSPRAVQYVVARIEAIVQGGSFACKNRFTVLFNPATCFV